MIALPQKLPHVIWRTGRLVPLSEGWLAESIEHAAAGAGYHRWHLAPEVARAIAVYLENDYISPSLTLDSLREMVSRSLQGIGFDDIAQKSLIVPPRVSISLTELAIVSQMELGFYQMLRERLTDALEVQVGGVKLEGLRDCSKVLGSNGRWQRNCGRISDEIIHFCRTFVCREVPFTVDLVIQ